MTRGAAVLPVSGVLLDVQELRAGAQAGGHVLHEAEHLGIAEVLLAEEEDEWTGALLLALAFLPDMLSSDKKKQKN